MPEFRVNHGSRRTYDLARFVRGRMGDNEEALTRIIHGPAVP